MVQGLTGTYNHGKIHTPLLILMVHVNNQPPKPTVFYSLIDVMIGMTGIIGMALGLVLSTVCTSESTALMGAVASFYPTIILSGIL